MKFIINKETKKVYIFEIIAIILFLLVLVIGLYAVLKPESEIIKDRDAQRELDLTVLAEAIVKYRENDEGADEFLSAINFCGDGWTEIGEDGSMLNLKSVLVPTYLDNMTLDPMSDGTKSGYDICKSYNFDRLIFRAPKAETHTIELIKKF